MATSSKLVTKPNCNTCCAKWSLKDHSDSLMESCLHYQGSSVAFQREIEREPMTLSLRVHCSRISQDDSSPQKLDAHWQNCSPQKVFSHADCETELIHSHRNKHSRVAAATRGQQKLERRLQAQEKMLKQVLEQQQVFAQKLQMHQENQEIIFTMKNGLNEQTNHDRLQTEQELSDKIEAFERMLLRQRERTKTLEQQIQQGINKIRFEQGSPPYTLTFSPITRPHVHFSPSSETDECFHCPPVFIRHQGYHLKLTLLLEDEDRSLVGLNIYAVSGASDEWTELKFPARFCITLELLNQHRDQDHIMKEIECELTKERIGSTSTVGFNKAIVPYASLKWNAAKQTQYLKNNCLVFRVEQIERLYVL